MLTLLHCITCICIYVCMYVCVYVFIYILQDFTLTVNDRMEPLKIEVFDEDVNDDDDSMGKVTVSIMDLVESKVCVTERKREIS